MGEQQAGGTALVRRQAPTMIASEELDRTWRVAKALALSRSFPDARTAEEALARILLGRDLGLNPTQSLTAISMVRGRPMIAATMLAAFVRRSGYDYRVRVLSNEQAKIEFFNGEGESLGISEFSAQDAERAGLIKQNGAWLAYPRNLLFARAMSNGVKWFTPDATLGIPVYHEGELEPDRSKLTMPGSDEPGDFGEDPQLATELREAFAANGFTPAKQRALLRGARNDEDRRALLASLNAEGIEGVAENGEGVAENGEGVESLA
jgi:hypothetical protein